MPQVSAVSNADSGQRSSAQPVFQCTLTVGGTRAAWIHAAGEVDLATAPQLAETLRVAELQARLVVLDTRDVTFMDSSGVHVIVDASHSAAWGGARVMVVPGPVVERVFAVTGAPGVMTFDLSPTEPVPALHLA